MAERTLVAPAKRIRIKQNYTNFIAYYENKGITLRVEVFRRPLTSKCLYRRGKEQCVEQFRARANRLQK